ncbi:MAG: peptidase T [Clostridia bacterium]|nr:peptidase T [Clostridia bacterium]MBQ5808840.1 peptidase T [Clostridia bacterium]
MNVSDRFLKYVAFPTMSCEESETVPSTDKQKVLGAYLVEELLSLGISNARMDELGYVYAKLPANTDKKLPSIGLIAHMDTSPAAADAPIKTKTVLYDGTPIILNDEKGIELNSVEYPSLNRYVGQHLIVTDGTTLLGADDKAGIAEIVTAVEKLIASGAEHGDVCIGFTPDEEIGRGADKFDVACFGADYAYTIDGGGLGELEYENFNAAGVRVTVNGVSIHPGSAKHKMRNAVTMAMEFNAMLPAMDIPELTECYEGFHHLCDINGDVEKTCMNYIVRDHSKEKFEARKAYFVKAAEEFNYKYGKDFVTVEIKDSYYNMREIIEQHKYTVERAEAAMRRCGVNPEIIPIRGGTDGARLSFEGLPCPNICTGGESFHSRFEYIPVESMEKIVDIIVEILTDKALA